MNHDQEVYEGAHVELSVPAEPAPRQTTTDANGRFVFSGVPAGNVHDFGVSFRLQHSKDRRHASRRRKPGGPRHRALHG